MTREEAEALIGTTVYGNRNGEIIPVTYSEVMNIWAKQKWREPKWVPCHSQYYPGCGTRLYDTFSEAREAALATIKSNMSYAQMQIDEGMQEMEAAKKLLAVLENAGE